MIKAVFFDLDGTIVDTEKYYRVCWPLALKHFGYDITDEQVLALRSMGRPYIIEYFKRIFGEKFDYEEVKEYRKKLITNKIKTEGLVLKKGVQNCLKYLETTKIKKVIVTTSDVERTKRYLKNVDLENCFDDIISGVNVKFGKPAPDVYILACKEIGAQPSDTIAIEDAPNGIESAYKAGCNVIMVPDQTKPTNEINTMIIGCIESLDLFKDFLESKKIELER